MLTAEQLSAFQAMGHVTVPGMMSSEQLAAATADVELWSQDFIKTLAPDDKRWYLERAGADPVLRKLDNPVWHRPFFNSLAKSSRLVACVEQLIGPGVSAFFSQVFCKPPEVGGPKPVHQDNFYFGPDDPDATLTVWIALDEATIENGCLFFGDGSHRGPVYKHIAPADEPFNLHISSEEAGAYHMTAAPVPAGGISFHHGNTWHQSSSNRSSYARRAVAIHYLRNNAALVSPALGYDQSIVVKVSGE